MSDQADSCRPELSIGLGARHAGTKLRAEGSVHGRDINADFLEHPPALQQAHGSATMIGMGEAVFFTMPVFISKSARWSIDLRVSAFVL